LKFTCSHCNYAEIENLSHIKGLRGKLKGEPLDSIKLCRVISEDESSKSKTFGE
jgi:hypothetical protein